jgi:hypothetical protein
MRLMKIGSGLSIYGLSKANQPQQSYIKLGILNPVGPLAS